MPDAIQLDLLAASRSTAGFPAHPARFVPICIARMPDEMLTGLPLYMRQVDSAGAENFTLYAGEGVKFTDAHRHRLHELGITFIYIPAEFRHQMRRQVEEKIETVADNASIDLSVRCEVIYESSLELIDETLSKRSLREAVPRLQRVARSMTALHLESPRALNFFWIAAHHDAYPATHAVNVAAWLPALAIALGQKQPPALATLCMGALLYDIGMAYLPGAILNHQGKLNAKEKQQMRQHPELGAQLLRQIPKIDPLVAIMALQHQERLDGTGYPRALTFDAIHPVARMAAVVDTFAALTSVRPYRSATFSPAKAVETLQRETPHRYDPRIVQAWSALVREACPEFQDDASLHEKWPPAIDDSEGRRQFKRHPVSCPATAQHLTLIGGIWTPKAAFNAKAHNLSRGGMGLLTREKLHAGQYFRVKLLGKDGVSRTLEMISVRARNCGDGWFEVGMRFVDLTKEAAPVPESNPMDGEFLAPNQIP